MNLFTVNIIFPLRVFNTIQVWLYICSIGQIFKSTPQRLFKLWLNPFEQNYDSCYTRAYGFLLPVISRVVLKCLDCGDLHQGFARVRCPVYHYEYLLAVTCHAKKVVQFGSHLQANILYPVPHWQYMSSMPKILLEFFKYNRKLLDKLCQYAQQSFFTYFWAVLRKPYGRL